MASPRIACLGTGLMGAPMVRRLRGAGLPVTVWNRSADKAAPLADIGARIAETPAEAVQGATHVITMLTDGKAVAETLFAAGVADAMAAGATLIDMSSIRPAEARAHAERLEAMGLHALDAPVSGGTRGAEAGTLAIMVGGSAQAFAGAEPVFQPMGRAVRVGAAGTGQLAKLANQAIVAITIGAVAEATLLMREGGASLPGFRDALSGGFADSTILRQHGLRMETGDYTPGGRSRIQLKDLDNVLAEAGHLGIRLPLVEMLRARFARLVADLDGGELDHAALFLELEDLNGPKPG